MTTMPIPTVVNEDAFASSVEAKPAARAIALQGLLTIDELTGDQLVGLLELAQDVKANPKAYAGVLAGKSVTMLFEKPSLRTRMSFEIGLTKLGAHVIYFDHSKQKIGERESVKDYAKNLERWTDAIIARVFDHNALAGLAQHGSIPVVNALSDLEHPCQALADMLTLCETFGVAPAELKDAGLRMAWLGDGNNVCHSLMLACAKLGVDFTAITPKGFEPKFGVVRSALAAAKQTGSTITIARELEDLEGHHAVYTDTWVSMGQEHQNGLRTDAFSGFTVDDEVMALAGKGLSKNNLGGAAFMHCLPAHRGEEVTDEVIDSAQSVVYEQAENRMHAQNALFIAMMGN